MTKAIEKSKIICSDCDIEIYVCDGCKMTKAIEKSKIICSDCDIEIYVCDGCGNYFHRGQEIICEEKEYGQKHYCLACEDN